MHTAVATSLTPSEADASTDATARPRSALVLAYGAEHVPRIGAASHAELDSYGRLGAGHVRERAFWDVLRPGAGGRSAHAEPPIGRCANICSVTSQGSPYARFQRALAAGNVAIVRAAAAELPRIGVAEAAAILLVIQRSEPANYERAARRWLAMLCQERRSELDLLSLAQAAAALDALPSRRPAACAALAAVCERAGLRDAGRVFTG